MAKKKDAEAPAPAIPTEAAPEKPATKIAAVRLALAAGIEKPAVGVPYVKEKFGMDVSPQQFSLYKGHIRKKDGEAPRARRKPGRKAADIPAPVVANGQAGNSVDLVRGLKHLIATFGAAAVAQMAEVLAE